MTATANSIQLIPMAASQPAVSANARVQANSGDAADTTFAGVLGGSMQQADASTNAAASPAAAQGSAASTTQNATRSATRMDARGSNAPRGMDVAEKADASSEAVLPRDASGANEVVSANDAETMCAATSTATPELVVTTTVPPVVGKADSARNTVTSDAGAPGESTAQAASAEPDGAVALLLPSKQDAAAQSYGAASELRHVATDARAHGRTEKKNSADAIDTSAATASQATPAQAAPLTQTASAVPVVPFVPANAMQSSTTRATQDGALGKAVVGTTAKTTAAQAMSGRAAQDAAAPAQDFASAVASVAAPDRDAAPVKTAAMDGAGRNHSASASLFETAAPNAATANAPAPLDGEAVPEIGSEDGTAATPADAAAAQNRLSAMAAMQQRGTTGTVAVAARPAAVANTTNVATNASAVANANANAAPVSGARPVRSGAAATARAGSKDEIKDAAKSGDVTEAVASVAGTTAAPAAATAPHAVAAVVAGHEAMLNPGTTAGEAMATTTVQTAAQHSAAQVGAGEDVAARAGDAPTAGSRIEVGFSDATLGPIQIHASVGSTGEVHVGVAGQAAHTEAVLEQITPLLHAAVVQQAAAQGSTSTFHVAATSAGAQADSGLSQRGGGDSFTSNAGTNMGTANGSESGRGSDGSRGQSSPSRAYAADALGSTRGAGADRIAAFQGAVLPNGNMSRGGAGLSVRI